MLQRTENPRTDFLYRKGAYLYFRFPKRFKVKPVGLPTDETSREFERCYDKCVATLRKMEADAEAAPVKSEPKPIRRSNAGTIGKAIEIYLGNRNSFGALKPNTQKKYRLVLERLKREIGDNEMRELDRDAVEDFADLIFKENGAPAMTDLYVTMINNVWEEVRKDPQFEIRKMPNPTIEIERRHTGGDSKPHLKWTEDLFDRFVDSAPDYLALAIHVLRFTIQRGGDAIRMRWDHYDGKGIKVWPEKVTAKGAVLDPKYHLLPRTLIHILDAAQKTATTEFILINKHGNQWGASASLSTAIRRHLIRIGLAKKGAKTLSMHGLRHTGASEIAALPGVGIKGIMTGTGHATEQMAARYAKQAEDARINADMVDAWNAELDAKQAARAAARRKKLKLVK